MTLPKLRRQTAPAPEETESDFQSHLSDRFHLRLHMLVLLVGVLASGFVADQLLLWRFEVQHLLLRYVLSISFSYLTFFALVRVWCWWILRGGDTPSPDLSIGDIPLPSGPSSVGNVFRGAGGNFGGAGASTSWEEAPEAARSALVSQSVSGEGLASGAGDAVSGALGDDGGLVLLAFLLLLAVLFGVVFYLIWAAPALLSGAAFHVLFAGGLARGTLRGQAEGWASGVLRRTWFAFVLAIGAATFFCTVAKNKCGDQHTLHDMLHHCQPPLERTRS